MANKITALIISGFPGIGKSSVAELAAEKHNFGYCDFESTPYRFRWLENGERVAESEWPGNYVDAIEKVAGPLGGYDVVMISTHKEVRDELNARGIPFIIVMPYDELLDEYMLRYVARGSDFSLIKQVFDNWYAWLYELNNYGAPVIHLKSGQFLADLIVPEIIRDHLRDATKMIGKRREDGDA